MFCRVSPKHQIIAPVVYPVEKLLRTGNFNGNYFLATVQNINQRNAKPTKKKGEKLKNFNAFKLNYTENKFKGFELVDKDKENNWDS